MFETGTLDMLLNIVITYSSKRHLLCAALYWTAWAGFGPNSVMIMSSGCGLVEPVEGCNGCQRCWPMPEIMPGTLAIVPIWLFLSSWRSPRNSLAIQACHRKYADCDTARSVMPIFVAWSMLF